jgi:hypothetical protein
VEAGAVIKRDKGDRRGRAETLLDMHHDLYHRAAKKLEPNSPDAKMTWPHSGECEWTRVNR